MSAARSRRRRRWWLAGLTLVGLLVLVQWQLLQVLKVPSASMAPFVHGDAEEGERIVVYKQAFLRRPPRRFEPVVFEHGAGADVQYLLKRVAGLAGEAVSVQDGDLFVRPPGEGRPVRLQKDHGQLQRLLVPVAAARFDGQEQPRIQVQGPVRDGALWLEAPAEGAAPWALRLQGSVTDGYQEPSGEWVPGGHVVWDLVVRATLVPRAPGTGLRVRLLEGMDLFEFELRPDEGRLTVIHVTAAEDRVPFDKELEPRWRDLWQQGRPVTVEVWNVDQTLGVALDGQVVFRANHRPVGDYLRGPDEGPGLALTGGAAEVRGFQVLRDLYYTEEGGGGHLGQVIPEGHVFVLGDHSSGSRDSRFFGPVALDALVGRPLAVCLPWARARWLR